MVIRLIGAVALAALPTLALAQTASPPAESNTMNPAAQTASPPAESNTMSPAAQTSPTSPTSTTGAASPSSDMGIRTANSATATVKFVTVNSADLMSSKLIGLNVYNNQNESVGEIEDIVIENGKTISGLVVSVGGFLGMGESYVVLDPASVVVSENDGKWRAHVNTSKDNLKNAPKFSYKKS